MVKSIHTLFTIIVFILLGCAATHFSNYWPYSQLPRRKVTALLPANYESSLLAIDSILTPVVKEHFKNQDSSVAVIEICEQIGGYFTTNWEMYRYNKQYHWPLSYPMNLPKVPTEITSQFISDGIYHPLAMLRVMFTCYHKRLNGQRYNWKEEIDKTKQLWPNGDPTDYNASLPDTVANIEKEIISTHYFILLNEKDTVSTLYNRPPQISKESSDWYYLTGRINYKIPSTESINITIITIKSEWNKKLMIIDRDTIFEGDTLTRYHKGWLSKNKYYFDYLRSKEFREDLIIK